VQCKSVRSLRTGYESFEASGTPGDLTWLEDFLTSNDLAPLLRWRRHCGRARLRIRLTVNDVNDVVTVLRHLARPPHLETGLVRRGSISLSQRLNGYNAIELFAEQGGGS